MDDDALDLCGKICPYPVVAIVREVARLRPGQKLRCMVDDPLALKSVPEELEEFPDVSLTISSRGSVWEVIVKRQLKGNQDHEHERDHGP
ncbi:MAG TPA: sulfurtransferase TusA family protein [Phycisphaerae bacterium]|nr:sulfurtransferase TusA family protein [Phycisphaerae bacterium]HNU45257.1 sulfurtransferase TusA family protein [Phycisphaerae bacterium]